MRSTMSQNSNERRKQGFTLMEMLIVVAVIAVLIAVAIPVFSSSLHKSRVATCCFEDTKKCDHERWNTITNGTCKRRG